MWKKCNYSSMHSGVQKCGLGTLLFCFLYFLKRWITKAQTKMIYLFGLQWVRWITGLNFLFWSNSMPSKVSLGSSEQSLKDFRRRRLQNLSQCRRWMEPLKARQGLEHQERFQIQWPETWWEMLRRTHSTEKELQKRVANTGLVVPRTTLQHTYMAELPERTTTTQNQVYEENKINWQNENLTIWKVCLENKGWSLCWEILCEWKEELIPSNIKKF